MGTKNNPGILPRTLDVIFNSIDDYMSESKVKKKNTYTRSSSPPFFSKRRSNLGETMYA